MSGQEWKGRLVQGADRDNPKAYFGIIYVCGFPYEARIERDWQTEKPAVVLTMAVDDRKKA